MERETTSTRLKKIMNERGLRQVDILKYAEPYCKLYDISLTKSALSQYISGKYEPSQDKLFLLGHILDVNEAWLMGYDVPMERESLFIEYDSDPGEAFATLIQRMSEMTAEKRDRISREFLTQLDESVSDIDPDLNHETILKRNTIREIETLPQETLEAILKIVKK